MDDERLTQIEAHAREFDQVGWDVAVGLVAEVRRLRAELDQAQLRSIEARNPGIDMDDVRRLRAGREA